MDGSFDPTLAKIRENSLRNSSRKSANSGKPRDKKSGSPWLVVLIVGERVREETVLIKAMVMSEHATRGEAERAAKACTERWPELSFDVMERRELTQ